MFDRALLSLMIVVALAVLGGPIAPAWGQVPEELVGRWVWTVEGRPTFILDIAPDIAGDTAITRPERVSFMRDGTISGAQGAVSAQPLSVSVEKPNRLTLVRKDGGLTYIFELAAPGSARLSFADAAIPPLILYRAYDPSTVLTDWGGDRAYQRELAVVQLQTNEELAALYEADQAPRQTSAPLGLMVGEQDRARRARVRELMAQGALTSGRDYFNAAMIFQHGDTANDYLLAHALATTAIAMNEPMASWLAAASLDRYLQNIGQSQIYGTQFQIPDVGDVTQGAYDRDLLPDAARAAVGVPSLAEQEEQRQAYAKDRLPPPVP
ncbi:hypothetical protein [Brevundimonas nasdae]|uniref:hypothetical protein n=1 Tax=Brevundimonas nasdae TaxID=172043 RepID=UPI00068AE2A1|nr:hypothetical protein [Brevundimonas nasdae]